MEQDLTDATSGLPRLLLTLLGWMSGIGVAAPPIGVGADLLVRRRPMQLIQALGAAVVGGVLVIVLAVLVHSGNGGFVTERADPAHRDGPTGPLDIVIVSRSALLTVADIWAASGSRRSPSSSSRDPVRGCCPGRSPRGPRRLAAPRLDVGLGFRSSFGATSTRPPGTEVARALVATGCP